MRIGLSSFLIFAMAAAALGAQQDDKARIPKKGDTIVVKGCLRGSAVEAAETLLEDEEGTARSQPQIPMMTYRLQGDKAILKNLKDKHDRMVVEVKGVLRSELSRSGIGADVGRTRISIGVDPRSARGIDQPVPVLEAKSFEGSKVGCVK